MIFVSTDLIDQEILQPNKVWRQSVSIEMWLTGSNLVWFQHCVWSCIVSLLEQPKSTHGWADKLEGLVEHFKTPFLNHMRKCAVAVTIYSVWREEKIF